MSGLLQQDKRGVSEVIGYVILIVIAISLSVGVYAFLRQQVPQNQPMCPEDVSLSIETVKCSGNVLNVTLSNRGLFSVEGAIVKTGDVGSAYKQIICLNSFGVGDPSCSLFNATSVSHVTLIPGDSWKMSVPYTQTGTREIEVEPIFMLEGKQLLCDRAVIVQQVTCG